MEENTWILDLFMTWWTLQTLNIILCKHMSGHQWKPISRTMSLLFYQWTVVLWFMLHVNLAEPCPWVCCSHVIAVLFSILDHVKKHRPILSKPCTSQECSWNEGKKRNNNPRQVSNAKYQNKRKQSAAHVIDFEPRPLEYSGVSPQQINPLASALNDVSRYSDYLSMWETQLKFTYKNYDLGRPSCA